MSGWKPVADATVFIATSDRSHTDIALMTDASGEFRFVDVEPGTYTLAARGPDGTASSATVVVAAGRVARVRLAP